MASGSAASTATPAERLLAHQVTSLQSENQQLRQALLGQLAQQMTTTAHVVAVDGGSVLSATTPAERLLAKNPAIARLVKGYFAAQVQAQAAGAAGVQARQNLARFFTPGSTALARARCLALGTSGAAAIGNNGEAAVDPTSASLALVRSLVINRTQTQATVTVWPVVEYQVWFDAAGHLEWSNVGGQSGEPWGIDPSGAPHRLQLVKSAGQWLISDDFSLDGEIPATLKKGGAPAAVWQAEQRRIAAAANEHIAVPAGVKATFTELVSLLNQRRFNATDRLYASGRGLRAADFQHPAATWQLKLVSVWRYNPLSETAVADPGEINVAVKISGPGDLLAAGSGVLNGAWGLRRNSTGQWLITAGPNAPVIGAPDPF
jgi:hypothetical protein